MTAHPLDPLSAAEIGRATAAVRRAHPEIGHAAFAHVALHDPPKAAVVAWRDGDRAGERRARVVVLDRATALAHDAIVRLDGPEATVETWTALTGRQPPIMAEEFAIAEAAARRDPRFVAALRRRGIDDPDRVQIDPLAAGSFDDHPPGRRILWATPYLREHDGANAYARPIENLRACVDVATGEVLRVVDGDPVPLPTTDGDYDEASVGGWRTGLRPLRITQPEGVSFRVDGHRIAWQGWTLHVALHPADGLVLSDVRCGGRRILHRASIAEMVVPYGDPHDGYYWRSYFDAGEYGLGRTTGSLEHGCDCVGEIAYLDATLATAEGQPETVANAICIHEEDHGVLWKHRDGHTGRSVVRRSRRLVVSHFATVGNYDYGFYWALYQDGSIELEVKLTGIVLTQAVVPGQVLRHGARIAPDLAGPHHQHLFCARLDMAVDGDANTVYECDLVAAADDPANPYGGAMEVVATPIERERDARRFVDPRRARTWRVVNPARRNAAGEPVGYKLVPHAGPLLLAGETSSVGRRAGFARAHVWVTRHDPEELHPAGDFPNQHPGGDGITEWVRADRGLVDTDVVLWHVFGTSHAVRPEDWPVMPVERVGFALKPVGFFDRNPGIDVPPAHG